MLHLPSITLLSIDVITPLRAIAALHESSLRTHFAAVILLTDLKRHPTALMQANRLGIKAIHHTQSNRVVTYPGIARKFFADYELALMTEPLRHMQGTHVLFCEPDAAVLNPEAWNIFWPSYDYIGAPWPAHNDPGWPPCDGITNAVGNSGFSLQSRLFCEGVADALAHHKDDPSRFSCDRWMCRTIRPWLETHHKVQFAPPDVAERFSCENRIYTGQFGFHGRETIKLNGWKGWLGALA